MKRLGFVDFVLSFFRRDVSFEETQTYRFAFYVQVNSAARNWTIIQKWINLEPDTKQLAGSK